MVTYGKWESEWKAKLVWFNKELQKKTGKPAEKVINDTVAYSQMGVGYRALDAAFAALDGAGKTEKPAMLSKALKDFKGAILSASAKGKLTAEKARKSKELLRKAHPMTGSAFDILCKTIDACNASADSAYADYDKELARLNNKWSLISSKESRDLKELIKFKQMLKKNLVSDIKSTLLWIKENEGRPNAKSFNDGVERETYNIYRYMNEFRAKCDTDSEDYRQVKAAMVPVEKWRTSKTVPANAGGDKVIIALANLKRLLAGVLKWAQQL